MVFNVMHNQNGGNIFRDINNKVSDTERQLYQDQIKLLKEEVTYLKKMLEKVLR
jgi:RNA polymerase-interacting CarD/CdnL/TRCF family regulator